MREGKPENNQGDKLANLERAEAEMMMMATASIPRLVSIYDLSQGFLVLPKAQDNLAKNDKPLF